MVGVEQIGKVIFDSKYLVYNKSIHMYVYIQFIILYSTCDLKVYLAI